MRCLCFTQSLPVTCFKPVSLSEYGFGGFIFFYLFFYLFFLEYFILVALRAFKKEMGRALLYLNK